MKVYDMNDVGAPTLQEARMESHHERVVLQYRYWLLVYHYGEKVEEWERVNQSTHGKPCRWVLRRVL